MWNYQITDANSNIFHGTITAPWNDYLICGVRGCQWYAPQLLTTPVDEDWRLNQTGRSVGKTKRPVRDRESQDGSLRGSPVRKGRSDETPATARGGWTDDGATGREAATPRSALREPPRFPFTLSA